jgi:predicted small integral membrane protein
MSDPDQPLAELPVPVPTRQGFLPIVTNGFDRVFISVIVFVAIHLLWMRFLEAHASLYIATAISLALGALIITRG